VASFGPLTLTFRVGHPRASNISGYIIHALQRPRLSREALPPTGLGLFRGLHILGTSSSNALKFFIWSLGLYHPGSYPRCFIRWGLTPCVPEDLLPDFPSCV
jgi:hypothetical protein